MDSHRDMAADPATRQPQAQPVRKVSSPSKPTNGGQPKLRFRVRLPLKYEQMKTERVYMQKCKTEAIERSLQDDRYLLAGTHVNEFIETGDHQDNTVSIRKAKRQLFILDRINRRMNNNIYCRKGNDSDSKCPGNSDGRVEAGVAQNSSRFNGLKVNYRNNALLPCISKKIG